MSSSPENYLYFSVTNTIATTSVAQAASKTNRCVRRLYNETIGDYYKTIYRIFQDRIRTRLGTNNAAA